MVGEGIQNYVDMAAGLTKATRAKATAAAKSLLASAGLEEVAADATDRVGKLTEEIMAASRANRELMGKLIAAEVDKAAAKLGFVRAEELDDLRRELAELRMSMAHAAAHTDGPPTPPMPETMVSDPLQADPFLESPLTDDPLRAGTTPLDEPVDAPPIEPIDEPVVPPTAAKKAAAKKAVAKKAVAKKAIAKKAVAKKAPATKTAATKTAATQTAAKKAPSEDGGGDRTGQEGSREEELRRRRR